MWTLEVNHVQDLEKILALIARHNQLVDNEAIFRIRLWGVARRPSSDAKQLYAIIGGRFSTGTTRYFRANGFATRDCELYSEDIRMYDLIEDFNILFDPRPDFKKLEQFFK